jgi:membrane associated rhomboid family serine protease
LREVDFRDDVEMIPLRDENPTKTFPFVTIIIIAINIFVFIYELSLGSHLEGKIIQFAVIPYNIIHLINIASLFTLVTSLFLHGGLAHIFGNMLYLWVFGNNIEDALGHTRFIFFYLLCGIIASLGHILTALNSKLPVIGASGAISGVLGAYLLLYPRAKVLVLIPFFFFWRIMKVPAMWFLGFWIMLQIIYGTGSFALSDESTKAGVAWFAHIAGFFAGIILIKLLMKNKGKNKAFLYDLSKR